MQVIVLIQLAFDLWCQSQSGRSTTGGLQIKPKGRALISPLVSRLCLMGMNREIPAHTHACFLLHRCSGAGNHIIRHFHSDDEGQHQMKGRHVSKHVKTATHLFLMDISLFVLLISKEGHRGCWCLPQLSWESTLDRSTVHHRARSVHITPSLHIFSFFNVSRITFLCRNGANIV